MQRHYTAKGARMQAVSQKNGGESFFAKRKKEKKITKKFVKTFAI